MRPLQLDANSNPIPVLFPGTKSDNPTIKVDGASASAASAVISDTERTTVRLYADNDCYIAIDTAPVATNSDIPLSAGVGTDLIIEKGCKIAVFGAILYIVKHVEV